ncbi:Apolipoprotein N-acyltransferase [Piscirickettsiaceae bacterium NZ-RLO1]|nr:Apolipoprotein N-acyltransferase [Piscirickettsiaceae bacterium NZ-RLO1]
MQVAQINMSSSVQLLSFKRWWGDGVALLSGILGTLSMAPFNFSYLAIVSALLLIFTLRDASVRRALWRGWLYGLGLFLTGSSWVYVSIATYSEAGVIGAAALALLFASILALISMTKSMLIRRFFNLHSPLVLLTAVPAIWVLIDWLQSWLFTGFPWLYLGYSQLTTPLAGFAPIFSVYGVTLAVVLSAAFILIILRGPSHNWRYLSIIGLAVLFAFGMVLKKVPWTQPDSQPFQVGLVQGNVTMSMKWDPEQWTDNIEHYQELSQPLFLNNKTRLIIWPETAVPILAHQIPGPLAELNEQAKARNIGLVFGIPLQFRGQFFNGMLGVGNAHGAYMKRHLVPFGEYWPSWSEFFGRWLNLPMSDFTAGKENQKLMRLGKMSFISLICYEVGFPELVREGLPWGGFIVAISDSSWFGHSIAKYQMLEMAQMRALETGRYFLNVDNSGVTAVISPMGKVLNQAKPDRSEVITGEVTIMQGATPWVSDGIHLIGLVILLLLAVAVFIQTRGLNK